tara:strand:- start:84 stop:215 length:132 start_codon:yes stop_codon:yes gene_type:complete
MVSIWTVGLSLNSAKRKIWTCLLFGSPRMNNSVSQKERKLKIR